MKTLFRLCRNLIRLTAVVLLSALFLSVIFTGLPGGTGELAKKIPQSPLFRYEETGNYLGKVTCLGISFCIDLTAAQTVLDKLNDQLEEQNSTVPELVRKGAVGLCDVIIQAVTGLQSALQASVEHGGVCLAK